jgi:hypothetical protein
VVNAILDDAMHSGSMTASETMHLLVGRAFHSELFLPDLRRQNQSD